MRDDLENFLRFRAEKGLLSKGLDSNPEYTKRLNYELDVICKAGFAGYLLIVADYINWAKNNGVGTGPGRGSSAGSLVCFCLGITQIDPIKFGLLFERFINPDRIALADVDSDFSEELRYKVVDYIKYKYGAEHVANIGTFGTMKSRGAIRDVARAFGLPYETADKLSSLTLPPVQGKPPTLKECFAKVPELEKIRESDTPEGQVLKLAERFEGKVRSFGTHASGIIISNEPLVNLCPLALDKDGNLQTQYDMHGLEDIGLVKFDFLGLTTLSVINKAIQNVKDYRNISIDINTIPLDDQEVFNELRNGNCIGVFQVEASTGCRDLLVQIRPNHINDLIALVAVYRPGPLGSDQLQQYLEVRAGREKPRYEVPELESILKDTDGLLIYQEQVIRIAVDLAGYTAAQGDLLRKAVGKKLPEEMTKQKDRFISGILEKSHPKAAAEKIWNEIEVFAGYGFNRAHAACYGFITYQTAWLKTHYPTAYMCAALELNKGNEEQIIKYIAECNRLNIKVLPPDINKSDIEFSVSGDKEIRFGLSAIKNLGEAPVADILKIREVGIFKDLLDFAARIDLSKINKTKMESLVLAGAFDFIGTNRASLLGGIDSVLRYKEEHKKYSAKLETYNKQLDKYLQRLQDIEQLRTKLKPFQEPVKPLLPLLPAIHNLPELLDEQILLAEKELLGFFVSGHPLTNWVSPNSITIEDIKEGKTEKDIHFLAVIASIKEMTTKANKQKMATVILEDLTGQIEGTIFPRSFEKYSSLLKASKPLVIFGKVERIPTQEGERNITRLIINRLEEASQPNYSTQETVRLTVPVQNISALYPVLKKYKGDGRGKWSVEISIETKGRALLKGKNRLLLSGNRQTFLKEIATLTN